MVDASLLSHTKKAKEWIAHLCEVLSEFRPLLKLKTSCRLDNLDESIIVMLQKAGFSTLKIGIETFCKKSQIVYKKRIQWDAAVRKLDFLQKKDMNVSIGFIMFDPYLNITELHHNLEFLLKYPNYWGRHLLLSKLIAYKGTQIEKQLIIDGLAISRSIEGTKWRFSDETVQRVYARFINLLRTEILNLEFDLYNCYKSIYLEHAKLMPFAECEELLKKCWIELFFHAINETHSLNKFNFHKRGLSKNIKMHTAAQ